MKIGLRGDAIALANRAGAARAAAQVHAIRAFGRGQMRFAGGDVIAVLKRPHGASRFARLSASVARAFLGLGGGNGFREQKSTSERGKKPVSIMHKKPDGRGPEPACPFRPALERAIGWSAERKFYTTIWDLSEELYLHLHSV